MCVLFAFFHRAQVARAGIGRGSNDCHLASRERCSLLVQDNAQEGRGNVDLAVILDESQLLKFVHEQIDA
jgi:hypothetical protein